MFLLELTYAALVTVAEGLYRESSVVEHPASVSRVLPAFVCLRCSVKYGAVVFLGIKALD